MIRPRTPRSLALCLFGAAALVTPACGDSGNAAQSTDDGSGNGADGGTKSKTGDAGADSGKAHKDGGTTGGGDAGPPVQCGGNATDATADALDFANNQLASPAPPGKLDPKSAPQIVVFGWDDVESKAGIDFVNSLLGNITNPNAKKGSCNLNPNACYGAGSSGLYACGDGTLSQALASVTSGGFDMGNHTIDHLEGYEPNGGWSGIPAQYKDTVNGGWKFTDDGFGPGVTMDQQTWVDVLKANDSALKSLYSVSSIQGFRAPRLEINDNGLNAIKAVGYQYDENLEEILPPGYVDAAIAVDTGANGGFNWIPWPYTLDNGSPGIWVQQDGGDKKFVQSYPSGVWEVPVYQVYVPSAGGMGKAIADSMLKSDNPANCQFPPDVPADQRKHCYLSDGELNPGDVVKEVTAFDFNTFIYSRMTPEQWLAVMKHTFLLRYHGNRAPFTYGAHPIEYTSPYDSYTLETQGNNYGYRDVISYNKYDTRQKAMQDFVAWIKNDPQMSKDTYFMSAQQLVAYMKKPFDATGAAVAADAVASPDSNGLFARLGWTPDGATLKVVDGNTADIVFNVTSVDTPVSVSAGLTAGALKGLSHIDIKYSTEVPFRVRLITADGSLSTTVLLAGTGGDRLARIRIKDFFPGPEATAAQVAAAGLVDANYMAKVSGISFESAANTVTGAKTFNTHIEQITLHGVATADLCSK